MSLVFHPFGTFHHIMNSSEVLRNPSAKDGLQELE